MHVRRDNAKRAIEHCANKGQFQNVSQRYELLDPFSKIFLCSTLTVTHT
jgi:hypothetical protein